MRQILLITTLALIFASGATAQTPVECQQHRYYGREQQAITCFEKLARSNSAYLRAEGLWGLEQYFPANDEFRKAVAAEPKNSLYRARWGELFLERFMRTDADKLFGEALELDEKNVVALLGLARSLAEDYDKGARAMAEKALKADPKSVEAYETLARVSLEDNNTPKAIEEADKALALRSDALDALAIRAAIDRLADKKENPWEDRALKVNPRRGELFATEGHFYVINRRYTEGIAAYRKAIQLSPRLFSAHAELGVNLMRLGFEDEARKELELCFNNHYASSMVKNTLTLMDSYSRFVTYKTPTTILRLNRKEAELLRPYFESELLRAMATYEKKYQMKLDAPVQVEVYPDHEDFAVRTMGLPGLGALGVTFNNVIAMDSPSGRTPGSFHWASTLWHELSHVYVLSATHYRVPRWFTEGLAVYEETAASPDWGDRLDPEAIKAIRDKKLLPIAELDRGFIHPTYPSQVVVSYFQAGKICEFIAQKWEYNRLLGMIHRFAADETTPNVISEELHVTPEEFDRRFLAWLDQQTGKQVQGFEKWQKEMKAIDAAARGKRVDEVISKGSEIRALYPDYVEEHSVYELLADAYIAKGEKARAMEALEAYSAIGGRTPETLKKLAGFQREAGKLKEAAATLERINFIYLKDEDMHKSLGEISMLLGRKDEAIREFQAVIHCQPLDKASAHYNLARAYQAAGRSNEAKDEVFSALEAAPGFKPAQKLLLEITQRGATD